MSKSRETLKLSTGEDTEDGEARMDTDPEDQKDTDPAQKDTDPNGRRGFCGSWD